VIPVWFEIVRRPYGRFSWLLVQLRRGRRRVLARSERDYRSRGKVRRVIEAIKDVVPNAPVFDATRPFTLPDTSFHIVGDVLPLPVGGPPADFGPFGRPVPARRRGPAAGAEPAPSTSARAGQLEAEPAQAGPTEAASDEAASDEAARAESPPAEQTVPTRTPRKRATKQAAVKQAAPGRRPSGRAATATGGQRRAAT
jgi:hypothetical protein